MLAQQTLGKKRTCQACEAKFYDLQRNPIICPKCNAPYQIAHQTDIGLPKKPVIKQDELMFDEYDTLIQEDYVDLGNDEEVEEL